MTKLFAFAAAFTFSGSLAFANITSTTEFGALPAGSFGGSGNPTSSVEITTATNSISGDVITLGLAAQQRYFNPTLTNNGDASDAIFFATAGANYGDPTDPTSEVYSSTLGSTWDVDYSVTIAGGGDFSDYRLLLLYDFAPAANTPNSQLGSVLLNDFVSPTATSTGDSENLDFGFLAGIPPIPGINPPTGASSFNPLVAGEYTFKLELVNSDDVVQAQSDINVDVASSAPDGASTAVLMALGGLTLAVCYRQKRSPLAAVKA